MVYDRKHDDDELEWLRLDEWSRLLTEENNGKVEFGRAAVLGKYGNPA